MIPRRPIEPLPAEQLRRRCDPASLPFETTDELELTQKIIGQDRAIRAIRLGLEIPSPGYNVFVVGLIGTGRNTAIKRFLEEMPREGPAPPDIVYVHNFKEPDRPRLLVFPAGRGAQFRDAIHGFVSNLRKTLIAVFESDEYDRQRKAVMEGYKEQQRARIQAFERKAEAEGFRVEQMQIGPLVRPVLVPVVEGAPVPMGQLEEMVSSGKLAKEEFERIEERQDALSESLETVVKEVREIEREAKARLERLDTDLVLPIVHDPLVEIRREFREKNVDLYLDQLEEDIVANLGNFRENAEPSDVPGVSATAAAHPPVTDALYEYRVNLLVDNSETKGPPVVTESSPNHKNLFGAIERSIDRSGEARSNFTHIKAGSFVRASGGYLVLNAEDVLIEPGVWNSLKRTLRTGTLEIQSYEPVFAVTTSLIKPEPIQCDVKVVMVGNHHVYAVLFNSDFEFEKIFKVKAEFDTVMPLGPPAVRDYAAFIRKITHDEKLCAFERTGAAAVVEYGMREAGRRDQLSTRFTEIADLIREASWHASRQGAKLVSAAHVAEALSGRRERNSLLQTKMLEAVERGILLIDAAGRKTGQVNGLALHDIGDYVFGMPSRITASLSMGRAGIIDIEREARLSGPSHSKGILILSGFLRGLFAQDKPLTLSAALAFEQTYGGVDGDSASSAEVYALLSALAEVPIDQGLAVTGSVNQKGEVQPIGGVNEKIEGWFAACKLRGLTGEQGALIPAANVEDLMLEEEIVEAVRSGRFAVYPVSHVAQGIELLTGVRAGELTAAGQFEEGSVYDRVDDRLREMADKIRLFGPPGPSGD